MLSLRCLQQVLCQCSRVNGQTIKPAPNPRKIQPAWREGVCAGPFIGWGPRCPKITAGQGGGPLGSSATKALSHDQVIGPQGSPTCRSAGCENTPGVRGCGSAPRRLQGAGTRGAAGARPGCGSAHAAGAGGQGAWLEVGWIAWHPQRRATGLWRPPLPGAAVPKCGGCQRLTSPRPARPDRPSLRGGGMGGTGGAEKDQEPQPPGFCSLPTVPSSCPFEFS